MAADTDWEAIEREYRAGQLSVSEIARQHGVSHTAINKRAKREGWVRDLSKRVREEVSARLVSAEVSAPNAREAIEAAAARGVEVVRQHRRDISSINSLAVRLRAKAEAMLDQEAVVDLKDLDTAAGIVESLARTTARLVPLERQAFSLDEKDGDDDGKVQVNIVRLGDAP